MIRKAAIAALAWVLLSAFSEPLPEGFAKEGKGDSIINTQSGFAFPPTLLSFQSANHLIHNYGPNDASVGYNYYAPMRSEKDHAPDITATVYIYHPRTKGTFENVSTQINAENAFTIKEISSVHKDTLRDLVSQPVKGKCAKKDILGAYNSFNVDFSTGSNQGKTLSGEVYIFMMADWIIKFRFTSNQKNTDTTLEFVRSFFKANEHHTSCT